MGSRADRARASQARLIAQHGDGGMVTIRQRSTLVEQLTGEPTLSLLNSTPALPGSTLLTMELPTLVGTLRAGIQFTIPGVDATVYTTQAEATADGGILSDVPIAPATTGVTPAGEPITLLGDTVDVDVDGLVTRPVEDVIQGTRVEADNRMVILDVTKLSVEVPLTAEIVSGGVVYVIQKVLPVSPNIANYAMRLLVGQR